MVLDILMIVQIYFMVMYIFKWNSNQKRLKKMRQYEGRVVAEIANIREQQVYLRIPAESIYYPTYQYIVNNKTFIQESSLGVPASTNLYLGKKVELFYDLSDPEKSVLKEDEKKMKRKSLCYMAIAITFLFLISYGWSM